MFPIHMKNNLKFINKKVILEEASIHKAHRLKGKFMKVEIKGELSLYQTMKV